jgi:LPXTG-motif cell wall-anchored protein
MLTIARLSEETGNNNLVWLLWGALGFFALMVVVGWLTSRNRKPEQEEQAGHKEEHPAQH